MPKRTQRQPLARRALQSANLLAEGDVAMDDGAQPGLKRAQRRKMARDAADPVGRRPGRRGVNVNQLARPANQARGKPVAPQDVAPKTNVVQTLRTFLEQRWNADARLLNLENMQEDPLLLDANIRPPGAPGAHKDLGTAIWKLSSEMFPALSTLSLANNGLTTLKSLMTLGQYLPKLANLSLERNELRWVRELDILASRKHGLHEVQELLLSGNPMHQNAIDSGNEDGYRRDVLAKFPSVRILDRRPVTEIELGFSQLFRGRGAKKSGPEAAKVPLRNFSVQIKPGFVDADAAQVVPDFLSQFFARYDQDRALLRPVYSDNARFSYSLNSSPPPRARAERLIQTMPHQRELVLDRYMALGPRNILRSHNAKALLHALHHGSSAIVAFLQRLPSTVHPLHDASKFVVDAWILPNVDVQAQTSATERPDALLYITVHGEFAEAPSHGLRSFDRAFVVAPAAPDSLAVQNGWPCTIVSDMLTIRHYSRAAAWQPDSLPCGPVDAAAPTPTAALPAHLQSQAPLPGVSPEQHTMALQLAAQTRLQYPLAVQCLVENQWDFARALANIAALNASQAIPPEAFVPT